MESRECKSSVGRIWWQSTCCSHSLVCSKPRTTPPRPFRLSDRSFPWLKVHQILCHRKTGALGLKLVRLPMRYSQKVHATSRFRRSASKFLTTTMHPKNWRYWNQRVATTTQDCGFPITIPHWAFSIGRSTWNTRPWNGTDDTTGDSSRL